MRGRTPLTLTLGILVLLGVASLLSAQPVGGPGAPWRGAGPQPCVGPVGGVLQCPPAARNRRDSRRPPVRQQQPARC